MSRRLFPLLRRPSPRRSPPSWLIASLAGCAALGAPSGSTAQASPGAAAIDTQAPSAAAAASASADPTTSPASPASPAIELRTDRTLGAPPRGAAARGLPIVLEADRVSGRPGIDAVAEGNAQFRRGGTLLRADRLSYDQSDDIARANGGVRIERDGNVYTGSQLELQVERFEGFFLDPTYYFGRIAAGGTARRIDFLGEQRAVAIDATYTSCPADGSGGPAWVLVADQVQVDLDRNEGIAHGAVLRFLGMPILAAPVFSFPLSDVRKSGWLPPSIGLDSRSGLRLSIPWYWNIAPNRDATFEPSFSSRRGVGLGAEFRYLEASYGGQLRVDGLPYDRTAGRSRFSLVGQHDADLVGDGRFALRLQRASDDAYWKDFPRELPSLTPRLLLSDARVNRPYADWDFYARAIRWQVLQSDDAPIDAPYQRLPQVGARTLRRVAGGVDVAAEFEYNRFTNPPGTVDANRLTADRSHLLASIARPFGGPGYGLVPKLSLNAASYALDRPLADGRTHYSRVIPTFSVDGGMVLEREARWFGRTMRQTLEPRLLYASTPYRDQPAEVNFDSAVKEFNFESIFSENAFSGVDRVSDAHQITAGVTTRLIEPTTGAEALRLSVAQRYLFRDQLITPDGQRLTQHFSDLLLLASSNLIPRWTLDAALQYNPETDRVARSVLGVRYSPGPFRTVNATYRLTRGSSEQIEIGWQWPIAGPTPAAAAVRAADAGADGSPARTLRPLRAAGAAADCRGTWYAVGRVNYSLPDSRLNDSIFGVEYDAGCWIARVVAERLSTGRTEATKRLLFQLELVGLSRLGSNPLQVLKDNIPGYRLLREDSLAAVPAPLP